jgi:ferrochelatase
MATEKVGLLLVNLGTPESPRPADVRRYLREFLSDPRVLDIPSFRRWLVLNFLILPFRPRRSGRAYAEIWTAQGSPLLVHTRNLATKVAERLPESTVVELAMRYGEPSLAAALERLSARGVERVALFPLYPQYSSAATGSTLERVFALAARRWNVPYLQVVPPFYDHPAFLDACAAIARPILARVRPDRVFFSFHGLPERHVRKSDRSGTHCLRRPDCCDRIVEANRSCYRAQCFATARLLADRLDVDESRRVVCFQSRLGRTPWIRPYTDEEIPREARAGARRAVILSPAFVADCLETLEELGLRAARAWREHGGETFELVPAVNASDAWADAVVAIARESCPWISTPSRDLAAPEPSRSTRSRNSA